MKHKIEKVKRLTDIKLEDIITGKFLRGRYTNNINGRPGFVLYFKNNETEKWDFYGSYCVGLRNLKNTINSYDLKIFKDAESKLNIIFSKLESISNNLTKEELIALKEGIEKNLKGHKFTVVLFKLQLSILETLIETYND